MTSNKEGAYNYPAYQPNGYPNQYSAYPPPQPGMGSAPAPYYDNGRDAAYRADIPPAPNQVYYQPGAYPGTNANSYPVSGEVGQVGMPLPAPPSSHRMPKEKSKYKHMHEPVSFCCPHCGFQGKTLVLYRTGGGTWIVVVVLCCIFWPSMCIPLCCPSCQDAHHFCPHCKHELGKSKFCHQPN